MKHLYNYADISKQGHWEAMQRQQKSLDLEYVCLSALEELRRLHPRMGLKKLYDLIQPDGIGRDKFIDLAMEHGYGVPRLVSQRRTTWASPWRRFGNLLGGLELTDVNQLWTSDITYFQVKDRYYYLVLILDVYSRRILGYCAADSLRATGPLKALQMAFKTRRIKHFDTLIHHSDRGVQYTSDRYVQALQKRSIKISMCDSVYENSHIERLNGIIKNEYLAPWAIDSKAALQRGLAKAVRLYNQQRPHWSLDRTSPVQFEQTIQQIPIDRREKMKIYTVTTQKKQNANASQLCLFN